MTTMMTMTRKSSPRECLQWTSCLSGTCSRRPTTSVSPGLDVTFESCLGRVGCAAGKQCSAAKYVPQQAAAWSFEVQAVSSVSSVKPFAPLLCDFSKVCKIGCIIRLLQRNSTSSCVRKQIRGNLLVELFHGLMEVEKSYPRPVQAGNQRRCRF